MNGKFASLVGCQGAGPAGSPSQCSCVNVQRRRASPGGRVSHRINCRTAVRASSGIREPHHRVGEMEAAGRQEGLVSGPSRFAYSLHAPIAQASCKVARGQRRAPPVDAAWGAGVRVKRAQGQGFATGQGGAVPRRRPGEACRHRDHHFKLDRPHVSRRCVGCRRNLTVPARSINALCHLRRQVRQGWTCARRVSSVPAAGQSSLSHLPSPQNLEDAVEGPSRGRHDWAAIGRHLAHAALQPCTEDLRP